MTDSTRILSRQDSERIVDQIRGFAVDGGQTVVRLTSWWTGELRWSRNRIQLSSDRKHTVATITRYLPWGSGVTTTNQLDALSLESAVRAAERASAVRGMLEPKAEIPILPPMLPMPRTDVWSNGTANVTPDARSEIANYVNQRASEKSLMSAGYVEMRAGSVAHTGDEFSVPIDAENSEKSIDALRNALHYETFTQAQCSVTIRHPQGRGSGWAGLSGYNWEKIDGIALADRAMQKCLTSVNPVRIEPGRYTVIMEPQAVCDLVDVLMQSFSRSVAEGGRGPFASHYDESLALWKTKLGLQIVDKRITISHDPTDIGLGMVPYPGRIAITWIDQGTLVALENSRTMHALPDLNRNLAEMARNAYCMSGGSATLDDMIASTKRGLLITRLSSLMTLDLKSLLTTGVTRDGLWLIENGRISKSVNNMRFTESPLFVLNQIEELGTPVPVFRPSKTPESIERFPGLELTPAIVPAIKANDFSFTAMNDAV